MPREDALSAGALAFFGDKYGEQVRVLDVAGFSRELCGGTHVERTGDIGVVLVTLEQGVAAGTRRHRSCGGRGLPATAPGERGHPRRTGADLAFSSTALWPRNSSANGTRSKALEKELRQIRVKAASASASEADADTTEHAGVRVWTPRFEGLDRKAHAAVVDEFRNRHRDSPFVALSAAVEEGGVHVIAAVSEPLSQRVKAADVMKRLGLRGGGRPDFAQGGGVTVEEFDDLRRRAVAAVRDMLGSGA